MILKIVGGFLTILASTMIGFVYSINLSKRPLELIALCGMMEMLETQLKYFSSILSDAFEDVSKAADRTVSIFFSDAAYIMKKDGNIPAAVAWRESVEKNVKITSLNNEDMNVLISFGKSLGNTDIEGQIKNIKFTVEQLKIQWTKAEDNRKKNEMLYKNLGFLGGLAIVIILI